MAVICGFLAAVFFVLFVFLKTLFLILIVSVIVLTVFTGLWNVFRDLTGFLRPRLRKGLFAALVIFGTGILLLCAKEQATVIAGWADDAVVLKNIFVRMIDNEAQAADSITVSYFLDQISGETDRLFETVIGYAVSGMSRMIVIVCGILLICPSLFALYFNGRGKLRDGMYALLPECYAAETIRTWSDMHDRFRNYLYVRIAVFFLTVILLGVGYYLIGMRQWFLLAVLGGIFTLVPYVGPLVGAIAASVIGLSGGAETVAAVMLLYAFVVLIDHIVLVRTLDRNTVHPLIVIPMILMFTHLFGLPGSVLCVPVYTFIKIVLTGSYRQLTLMFPDSEIDSCPDPADP